MPYPEYLVAPMRQELTRHGVAELRSPEQVDAALTRAGTTLVVVNSVCGCAARNARPRRRHTRATRFGARTAT